MGLGFELAESMTGSFYRFTDPMHDHVMRVTLRVGVDGLRRFARDRRMEAEGVIVAEGLAENGGAGFAIHGALAWKLLDQNRVPYELRFEGDDGRMYSLRGQRDFFLHNAIFSLTTLAASLYDDQNEEIGRAILHFEPRIEIPSLVKSFRPRLRVKALENARARLKSRRG